MKHFILLIAFLCCVFISHTQVNNNVNNSNSKETNNNGALEEAEIAPVILQEKKVSAVQDKKESTQVLGLSSTFMNLKTTTSTQLTSRSPSRSQQNEMNAIVNNLERLDPQSFEFHYFSYLAGNYDVSRYEHLKKAAALQPNNLDVGVQLAAYHIIKGEKAKAGSGLSNLLKKGKISKELLIYNQDVLNSVPKNGILLVHGFDDGFGMYYLNMVKGLRKDVSIISLDFMQSTFYRDSLSKAGFLIPGPKNIDVAFLNSFCELNASKGLYISMTFPKNYLVPLANRIAVRGLVFEYQYNLKTLFKENEALYIQLKEAGMKQKFQTAKAKSFTANYLPMLLYLRSGYQAQNNTTKVSELDDWIEKIGVQTQKTTQINKIIN